MENERTHAGWQNEETIDLEPHFDDESTLLAAQPVVPLAEVKTKLSARRRWFLTGALSLSLMLGAATALAIAYFQRGRIEQKVSTEDQPGIELLPDPKTAEPTASVESAAPVESNTDSQPSVRGDSLAVVKPETRDTAEPVAKHVKVVKKDTATTVPRDSVSDRRQDRVSVNDGAAPNNDAMIVDQWEERRLRRAERRENRARMRNRQLFRIREIFEGTRRPE